MPVLVDTTTDPENKDEWRTDPVLFELCNREFKFHLDAAASAENALCHNYYTQEDNALTQDWYRPVKIDPGPGGLPRPLSPMFGATRHSA